MTLNFTTNLSLSMAVPGSGEPFSTVNVNSNWSAIDVFAGSALGSIATLTTNYNNLVARHNNVAGSTAADFPAADLAAMDVLAGMLAGDTSRPASLGTALFVYNGTIWQQATPATFAGGTARDTEYAKASAKYLIQGFATAYRSDLGITQQYMGLYNSGTNVGGRDTAAGWSTVTSNIRRDYSVAANVVTQPSGTVYFTQAIHGRTFLQRVFVKVQGGMAASGATTGGFILAATTGGTITAGTFNSNVSLSGSGIPYTAEGWVDIAASPGTDITITLTVSTAAGTMTFSPGIVRCEVKVAGEYS